MKTFLLLALSVTALFLWQRQGDAPAPAAKPLIAEHRAAKPGETSEHNWAKNSLDRAHEVMDQVRQSREQNEQR